MPSQRRERLLRRLHLRLSAGWSAAWLLCVAVLCALAIVTHARLARVDFAAALQLRATAVYGLTWFDRDGGFHGELLRKEPGLIDGDSDVWVVVPGPPPRVVLQPAQPRFDLAGLPALAVAVVRGERELVQEGNDQRGQPYSLHAKVTYDDADRPVAAILVVADRSARDAAHAAFVRGTLLAAAAMAALGVLVGQALSRRALRPVVQSFERQERFIAAAAHELRTPVARLLALCESARSGDEAPAQALARAERVATQTAGLVEQLLLLARLDAAATPLARERVRLDLLVEAVLPEEADIAFHAVEGVVEADPRLLQTAVRNLVDNALIHGAGAASTPQVTVSVGERQVCVEDNGHGFPAELLQHIGEPFAAGPASAGSGLGLSIAQHIAYLHGGTLQLENRAEGGARAVLQL